MINTEMDPDAGGSDAIAATVAESVALAMARREELRSDIAAQGSAMGDQITLPGAPDIDSTILHAATDG